MKLAFLFVLIAVCVVGQSCAQQYQQYKEYNCAELMPEYKEFVFEACFKGYSAGLGCKAAAATNSFQDSFKYFCCKCAPPA